MIGNREKSGANLRLVSSARRKKQRRSIGSVAEDASSIDKQATRQMLDDYFRAEDEDDRKPRQFSLLISLVMVLIAFYVVWPAFQEPLDIGKKDQEVYLTAGGSTSPPPSIKKEQKKQVKKEMIPNLYPEVDELEMVVDEDVEISDSGDWQSLSIDGKIDGTDFGFGEGGVGPYIKAGPGGLVPQPELIHRVEPDYPDAARRARVDGFVLLQAIVNQKGNVVDVKVLQAPDAKYGFAEKAIEAVSQWRFKPSYYQGRPVSVQIRFSVDFNLLF